MKDNKQIISEDTLNFALNLFGINKGDNAEYEESFKKEIEQFATNLLKKLQMLDRENVEKIFKKYPVRWSFETRNKLADGKVVTLKDFVDVDLLADKILQLIPQQKPTEKDQIFKALNRIEDEEDIKIPQKRNIATQLSNLYKGE